MKSTAIKFCAGSGGKNVSTRTTRFVTYRDCCDVDLWRKPPARNCARHRRRVARIQARACRKRRRKTKELMHFAWLILISVGLAARNTPPATPMPSPQSIPIATVQFSTRRKSLSPPWGTLGAFDISARGLPSDKVTGMGLPPKNKLVVFLLTFQKTRAR